MAESVTGEARMLIDGELVEAASGARYDNVNPATESVIGQTADASPEDMQRAVAVPGADRCRGCDHAVELPVHAQPLEDRARARGRQHRRPEARTGHPVERDPHR